MPYTAACDTLKPAPSCISVKSAELGFLSRLKVSAGTWIESSELFYDHCQESRDLDEGAGEKTFDRIPIFDCSVIIINTVPHRFVFGGQSIVPCLAARVNNSAVFRAFARPARRHPV